MTARPRGRDRRRGSRHQPHDPGADEHEHGADEPATRARCFDLGRDVGRVFGVRVRGRLLPQCVRRALGRLRIEELGGDRALGDQRSRACFDRDLGEPARIVDVDLFVGVHDVLAAHGRQRDRQLRHAVLGRDAHGGDARAQATLGAGTPRDRDLGVGAQESERGGELDTGVTHATRGTHRRRHPGEAQLERLDLVEAEPDQRFEQRGTHFARELDADACVLRGVGVAQHPRDAAAYRRLSRDLAPELGTDVRWVGDAYEHAAPTEIAQLTALRAAALRHAQRDGGLERDSSFAALVELFHRDLHVPSMRAVEREGKKTDA